MIRNYLMVALRFLAAHRLFAALNIAGLAVGLAAATLLSLFVVSELSYDRWIPDGERIYRMHTRFDILGREPLLAVSAPGPSRAALEKDYPEIEAVARMFVARPVITRGADSFIEEVVIADPNYFDVFSLPFVAGDRAQALTDDGNVVISERMARKYFGDKSALGETLSAKFRWGQRDLRVAGVFKDLPDATHLKLDIVTRINEQDLHSSPWVLESWTSVNTVVYMKLKPGAAIDRIQTDLPAFEERNVPNERAGGEEFKVADYVTFSMLPLYDLHLKSVGFGDLKPQGDSVMVATFAGVALLILVIAGINFTNLSTARASLRAREVAMRKVLGAGRGRLIAQFLGESVLMAVIAAVVSIVLATLALPYFNQMIGKQMSISPWGADGVLPALLGVAVIAGFGAGAYPAFYLSRFLPAKTLKANKSAATEGSGRMRATLVIIQFAISIALIICTAVVYGQVIYARSMDVGFDKSGLLSISGFRAEEARSAADTLKEQVSRLPGVIAVTRAEVTPADEDDNNTIIQIPGQVSAQPIVIGQTSIDYGFFGVMGIPLLAGRELSEEFGADDMSAEPKVVAAQTSNVVINRRAMNLLGITNPVDAIGREFRMGADDSEDENLMLTVKVVGVVENVNFMSARKDIRSMIYFHDAKRFVYLLARARNVDPGILKVDAARLWRELVPSRPFEASFAEEAMAKQYAEDEGLGRMFAVFAGLAVLIACLGLYGLASFTAERRTKEIGIRKVLGARTGHVVRLLAWDFARPVLVANAIAWPVAWIMMRDWLDGFQHRIDLGAEFFVVAGATALTIALVTVSGHAFKVARANAIHALRYE